ncbi:MAG: FG-GAP-like repeat-containing protein, partial [Gemmataceae bacterium]
AGFDGKSLGNAPRKIFGDFFAFEQSLRNGIFVTAGDLNGDGFADLICGGGPGGGPRVLAFDGKQLIENQQANLANFFGGDSNSRGGIRMAVKDLDGDNRADLVVGAGAGAGSRVTAYRGKDIGTGGTPANALDFDAINGFSGGVFVG